MYAQAEFASGFRFTPTAFQANDGSVVTANYYHFGDASGANVGDRSFGGIASTTLNGDFGDGIGHVGIRLKNGTATMIRNIEIVYAMEHWYNSGQKDKARVDVSYLKPAAGVQIASLLNSSGTWVTNTDLSVDAPSTATVVASRDGNSPANRRVRQTTLTDINLAPNQEIMIRWSYVLNTETNGNGLSIDDVTISAFTNVFYSKANGNVDEANNWGTASDGTGARPANFTFSLPNATYYVQGNSPNSNAGASRIGSSSANTTWTVNGANSKIVVGLPGSTAATRLYLNDNDYIVGRVEVESNATLAVGQPNYAFTLGELDPNSTVEYITTDNPIDIAPVAYGNLKLTGVGEKRLIGNTLVNSGLIFSNIGGSAAPDLILGNYNLTLQRGGQILGYNANAFIVTNGRGVLKQTVSNTGVDVVFPVGSSATSYTPAYLQQPLSSTARNEDVYSVRVIDGLYRRYDTAENGTGTAVNDQNVKKTWLVDEEVPGNSNVTMALQWNTADEVTGGAAGTNFDRTKSYIGHYLTSGSFTYFDKVAPTAAVAGNPTTSYKITRAGLTSFSPYAVSSNTAGPLPVQLVAFGAERVGTAVQCSWKTASEKSNGYFELERSLNGLQFEKVGTVAGAGTSTASHNYSLLDVKAPSNTLYYRLRQVDVDGTATYSPVAVVHGCLNCAAPTPVLAVLPNPAADYVRVAGPNGAAVPLHGTLYTILGSARQSLRGQTALDLRHEPAGVYLLRLTTEQGPVTLRVVKE